MGISVRKAPATDIVPVSKRGKVLPPKLWLLPSAGGRLLRRGAQILRGRSLGLVPPRLERETPAVPCPCF